MENWSGDETRDDPESRYVPQQEGDKKDAVIGKTVEVVASRGWWQWACEAVI